MGFIGKLLVLLFGAGSLMCLMWSTMIYTQKMDFVTPKSESGKKAVSRVEQAQARTKELILANNRAFTRWTQEYDQVLPVEIERAQRRDFYRGQLEILRTGVYEGRKQQVQKLDVDPNTGLVPYDKPTGRDLVMVNGKALETITFYENKLRDAGISMETIAKETKEVVAKHADATRAMNGRENPFLKGLRIRIKEQDHIEAEAIAEELSLQDFVTNREADAQLFMKRVNSLRSRLLELNNFLRDKSGTTGN